MYHQSLRPQGCTQPGGKAVQVGPRQPSWRWTSLLVAVAAGFAPGADAEPCPDDVAEQNVVQLTAEECTCCYPFDFVKDREFIYVLFYSHKGSLNLDINAKFEQLASDWKWSRIHFARVNADQDREITAKWLEPGQLPTNIMYKRGRPVVVKPPDFLRVRDSYQGNPEGQRWLLTKYLGSDVHGSNLHFATPLVPAKKLAKFVKRHDIAVVGFFKREFDAAHKAFSESAWRWYQDADDTVGAGLATVTSPDVVKKEGVEAPRIIVYANGKAVERDGAFWAKTWTADAVTAFIKQFLPLALQDSGLDGLSTRPFEEL